MSVTNVVLLLTLHTIVKSEHSEPSSFKEVGSQLCPLIELAVFIYFRKIGINVTVQTVGGGLPNAPLVILTVNIILCGFVILFKSKFL